MQRRETERQHEQRINSYAFLAARELEEPWASLQVSRAPLPCWSGYCTGSPAVQTSIVTARLTCLFWSNASLGSHQCLTLAGRDDLAMHWVAFLHRRLAACMGHVRVAYPGFYQSKARLMRLHDAGQGRSPTSAESGVAWTLLREEPPGGQAMDLPRSEWRTAILAGEAGALLCPMRAG